MFYHAAYYKFIGFGTDKRLRGINLLSGNPDKGGMLLHHYRNTFATKGNHNYG